MNEYNLPKDKNLQDGVYDLTDIEYQDQYEPFCKKQWDEWVQKYPEAVFCSPYNMYRHFLLSKRPSKVEPVGTALITEGHATIWENCPVRVLIAFESD